MKLFVVGLAEKAIIETCHLTEEPIFATVQNDMLYCFGLDNSGNLALHLQDLETNRSERKVIMLSGYKASQLDENMADLPKFLLSTDRKSVFVSQVIQTKMSFDVETYQVFPFIRGSVHKTEEMGHRDPNISNIQISLSGRILLTSGMSSRMHRKT